MGKVVSISKIPVFHCKTSEDFFTFYVQKFTVTKNNKSIQYSKRTEMKVKTKLYNLFTFFVLNKKNGLKNRVNDKKDATTPRQF